MGMTDKEKSLVLRMGEQGVQMAKQLSDTMRIVSAILPRLVDVEREVVRLKAELKMRQ